MGTINLKKIPQKPGIYQFYDHTKRLLYIGKAKKLRSRVSTYFHKSSDLSPSKQTMVSQIKRVEYIITSTETEALLLESSLIKRHQPPYNVDLKDDKNFLFIKVTVGEEFPRVFTSRKITKDGAKYFGPFVSAASVRQTLRTLRKLFPHRNFTNPPSRYQLEYSARRYPELMGPLDAAEYGRTISQVIEFLKGNYSGILQVLEKDMARLANSKRYERAAGVRDKIAAIKKIMEKQKVFSTHQEDCDIVSLAREGREAAVNVFMVRQGKLIDKQSFILTNVAEQLDGELLQTFVERFYAEQPNRPNTIVLPTALPGADLISEAFRVRFLVPVRGLKKQYLTLGTENAQNYLEQQRASWEKNRSATEKILSEIRQKLKLVAMPRRIETFDISNIQGESAVGSMVVFTDGQPDKKWYRKFKIRTVTGSNDPAMLAEVVKRRFGNTASVAAAREKNWPRPDLVILDGGKGQLGVVGKLVPRGVPVVALAKREEEIFRPAAAQPLQLQKNSGAYFLFQRMRDEAHRFAISYFRSTHRRTLRSSALDAVPGLGPKKKKLLLNRFGTSKAVSGAPLAELKKIVGIALAKKIKPQL